MVQPSTEVITYSPDMVDMLSHLNNPSEIAPVITPESTLRYMRICEQRGEEPLHVQNVINHLRRSERPAIRECLFPPVDVAKSPILGVRAEMAGVLADILLHSVRPAGIAERGAENFGRFVARLYDQQSQ